MQIWRIDVNQQSLSKSPVPEGWERLGGRGLLARIMLDEVDPSSEPLGPKNKLIFAPGLLVGHMLSSSDRISIGGKSPLTGGIKEANAGGRTGYHLANMGIKALIIEGQPTTPGLWILHLSQSGASWENAQDMAGMGVYQAAERLVEKYGRKVAMSLVGPGAELKLTSAGIQNLDKDCIPSRIAARGGLGAVMATKGLKAIVFDAESGQKPPIHDPAAFKKAQKEFTEALLSHPQTAIYRDFGTLATLQLVHGFKALPTRNFSSGVFEKADAISGEAMRETLLRRGGKSNTTHACMAGCTIRCSNVIGDAAGEILVSPLEFETAGLMGSNLGIDSLDVIAQMNREVNDLGLDSIEIGAALGVACDAGLMSFGDGDRALQLIAEIRQNTPLGRILGMGASITGRVLGVERVPVAKGQAMSAYDPRAIKGIGVTFATAPQGADHTCGQTIRSRVNHLDPAMQKSASLTAQLNMAGYDSLGICIFAAFGYSSIPSAVPDLVNARYGWAVSPGYLQELGGQTIKMEREWNRAAGFTKKDDRLPEWMTREPLPPHNTVFDVSENDLDSIFNDL